MVAAQDAETTPLLISKKGDAFSSSASWKKKSIVVGAFFVAVACLAVVVGTIRDRGIGEAPFYSILVLLNFFTAISTDFFSFLRFANVFVCDGFAIDDDDDVVGTFSSGTEESNPPPMTP